jgi:hypothetical protein
VPQDFFETQAPKVRNCALNVVAFAFSDAAHCLAALTVACCWDADAAFACAETHAPNDA